MEPADIPLEAPAVERQSDPQGHGMARLRGDWTVLGLLRHAGALAADLPALRADATLQWDLSAVSRLDTAGALLLWRAWSGQPPPLAGTRPEHRALFDLLAAGPAPRRARRVDATASEKPAVNALQASFVGLATHLLAVTALAGQLLLDALTLMRHPGAIPWRELSANVYRTGTQALGITALVGFLVGITLSYLTARQLQNYGADIFVINILGLSIPRELGPLLAAIIVAGRSGSSMTAQLGVMRVTQELDALSVLGISHTLRLVLPKVLALAVALPLVVVWTSAVMLGGGMLAAQAELGIDPLRFVQGLPAAVPIANLLLGWTKAVLFGGLIALLACHFGLRIEPNTESLGAGVTQSVVVSITAVIVVDAIFAVAFSNVGL
ncbi:MAG: ABC transporter permease [Pseudomonadota bacterium]|nr:ABC transporter permease [Pseudomonadota bacterium]